MTDVTTITAADTEAASTGPSEPTTGVLHALVEVVHAQEDGAA
ncbi:hypothetical protein ACFWUP_09255 [Nocardia sp. NPDC058658]